MWDNRKREIRGERKRREEVKRGQIRLDFFQCCEAEYKKKLQLGGEVLRG